MINIEIQAKRTAIVGEFGPQVAPSFCVGCLMRFRLRYLCLAIIPLAALMARGLRENSERHYCTCCGLMRFTKFRTLFGFTGRTTSVYRETAFHRALLLTGDIDCSHQWRAFYWNHHNVHPGEIHVPLILTNDSLFASYLERLAAVRAPDRRAAILTSIDLNDTWDFPHLDRVRGVLVSLGKDPDASREDAWWEEYGPLFEGRRPPGPALRRTRPIKAAPSPMRNPGNSSH